MKPILIRPSVTLPGGLLAEKSYVAADGDQSFDMLSYLTNEFENADIRAELIELSPGNSALQAAELATRLKSLTAAARTVIERWEGGDLAAAVRNLAELVKEGE